MLTSEAEKGELKVHRIYYNVVLVGWLVGWSVGWLVGWLVGWSVGRSVGWLVDCSVVGRFLVVCLLVGSVIGCLFG